ncbi:MAG: DUF58 domain-containing protein [Lentisphaeraceae bacterium]|nr:DUF58 domain-containing protein [Lentisphaeraceae bacterium]
MINQEILAKVRNIEIRTRRIVNELTSGAYKSVFKGRGVEFAEVREYIEGDDVRSIDWNVTARTGTPHIKRFEEERDLCVFIMADISASGDFGSQQAKNQLIAEIAAVLSFSAIRNKDYVGLMLFTDREELHLPPKKGKRHVLRLVRELLTHQRQGKKGNIAFALDKLMTTAKRKTITFLISDLMCEGFERSLAIASQKHDIIILQIMDPLEKEIPKSVRGRLFIEDAESGFFSFFNASSPKQRDKLKSQASDLIERNKRICSKAGVDIIEIENGQDYVIPLMNFFKKRGAK